MLIQTHTLQMHTPRIHNPVAASCGESVAEAAGVIRDGIGGGKLQDNHDRLEQWLAGQEPGPLTIEVALVHGCNHNCIHCYPQQFNPYDPHKSFLDGEVFKNFLMEFREMGGVETYFAGTGEPLLHPHFKAIMAHGHELGLRMTFSSNGIMLTEANAEKILPYTTWVRFSVNGGNAETYTRVHACHSRDFARLVRNLEHACQVRDTRHLPVQLAMQFVVFEANWRSIPDMVALHRHLGTDKLIFRNRFDREGYKHPVHPEAIPLLEMAARDERVEVRWNSFPWEGEVQQAAWQRCDGIHFRTHMDHEGSLFACVRHFHKESRFGNIHTQSFKDIWHSAARRQLFAGIACGGDIPLCSRLCSTAFDNVYIEEYVQGKHHGASTH
ncbi:MAG: radical SAM protein [Magnetococcales bacterium]|nr:radical SAM protein [Magnetococcales bacterium]